MDDFGQVSAITDQGGHTTTYGYDAIGRIARIGYPYDSRIDSASWYPKVFSYAYVTGAERGVAAGHWRRTVTQGNATDTTWFDAELRPVLHDTGNGSADVSTATGYDWRGLATFASYPVAGSPALSAISTGTRRVYDALGRLTQPQQDSELGTLTTTTAYLFGARKQVTDPKGNATTTSYQVFDQPSYGAPILVQAPGGITQAITRDVYGNPLAITQSGSYGTEADSVSKTLVYDSYHRLCRSTEPETGSTVLAYDAANNLAWSAEGQSLAGTACSQSAVPAAAKTTRSYDAMNRVLTIAPPAGTQGTTYSYDALGRVLSAVTGPASQGFTYNSLGELTSESLQVDGHAWTLAYGYDAYGHRATVVYPNSNGTGETVSYAPDAWGRPTQAGGYATDVAYFPNGQVESFAYINGHSYLAQQNTRQLTANFSDGAGSTLDVSEDVAYDADGNITTVTDLASGGLRSKRFGYDAGSRLTRASAPGLYGTEAYSYDALNNLRTRLTGGQTLTYHYDASNRLASLTQGATVVDTRRYNAQGDTIAQNATTLSFDAGHRLTGIPGLESYRYDAAGRRVEKQPASGAPTYTFYDQAGQLMFQYAKGTATTSDFIYLGTHLVAQHDQNAGTSSAPPTSAPSLSAPAQSATGNYTVSWSAVGTATAYTVQQSTDGGGWNTVQAGSAMRWGASGQATGSYGYRVQACNASGCGPWSSTGMVDVLLPPDEAPSLSVPASSNSGSYTVSWGSVATSSSYTLQASINGGSWSTVQSGSATSWSASGQATGSDSYRVQACNASGCGPWSGIGTVAVTRLPATPTGLQAAITADSTNALRAQALPASPPAAPSGGVSVMMMARPNVYTLSASWNAVSGASRYDLQYCKAGGACTTTGTTGTAVYGIGITIQGGGYTVSVRACNASGCSAWSAGVPA